MKAIFGLGNPGAVYKNNRHNIGCMVIDRLVSRSELRLKKSFRLSASIAKDNQRELFFIKPRTFMNNSGVCVKKTLGYYKLTISDILIVYDDVDLPLGALRFRGSGSSGGHRGMASIIRVFGSEEINRLRIGVGRPNNYELSDHVLSDFSNSEKARVDEIIDNAASACIDWFDHGIDFVTRNYNRRGG